MATISPRRWTRALRTARACALLTAFAAATAPASGETVTIQIQGINPFGATQIAWGDTVDWVNTSNMTHDAVADGDPQRFNTLRYSTGTRSETFDRLSDASASYGYFCSVGTHREQGMVGTIVVGEHTLAVTQPASGSQNPAVPASNVALSVAVSDNLHAVVYRWSASCEGSGGDGSFDNDTLRLATWTAPANDGPDDVDYRG